MEKKNITMDDLAIMVQRGFDVVDERFDRVEGDLKELKEDFNNLQTSVDKYAEKADAYFQEMVMLSQKVDRHEKWFQIVADKLGIKLPY